MPPYFYRHKITPNNKTSSSLYNPLNQKKRSGLHTLIILQIVERIMYLIIDLQYLTYTTILEYAKKSPRKAL